MRVIKFRGFSEEKGTWLFGDLVQNAFREMKIVRWAMTRKGLPFAIEDTVERDSVGQCTGLHDVTGKAIYEGDILAFATEDCCDRLVVVWDNGAFVAEYVNRRAAGYRVRSSFFAANPKAFRIIGNVHDNSDLLKVEQRHE